MWAEYFTTISFAAIICLVGIERLALANYRYIPLDESASPVCLTSAGIYALLLFVTLLVKCLCRRRKTTLVYHAIQLDDVDDWHDSGTGRSYSPK